MYKSTIYKWTLHHAFQGQNFKTPITHICTHENYSLVNPCLALMLKYYVCRYIQSTFKAVKETVHVHIPFSSCISLSVMQLHQNTGI